MKRNRAGSPQTKADELRNGREPRVDAKNLWRVTFPGPHERAVLLLASTIAGDVSCVPGPVLEQAAEFYNSHGLAATLDEIVRRGGSLE